MCMTCPLPAKHPIIRPVKGLIHGRVENILLLLVWPEGQDQGDPFEPFETVAACQDYAVIAVEDAVKKHGTNARTQFHCLNKDRRIIE